MAEQRLSYHHGDLRQAAITEALAILEAGDDAELGLRAVAARVGVSPAALYRHFADRNGLLAAAAERGFVILREALAASRDDAAAPAEQLGAMCRAYVDLGAARPGVYRLIFAHNHFAHAAGTGLAAAALAAFAELERAVAECLSGTRTAEARPIATAAWSALHGAVVLRGIGLIPVGGPGNADSRAAAAREIADVIARAVERLGGQGDAAALAGPVTSAGA